MYWSIPDINVNGASFFQWFVSEKSTPEPSTPVTNLESKKSDTPTPTRRRTAKKVVEKKSKKRKVQQKEKSAEKTPPVNKTKKKAGRPKKRGRNKKTTPTAKKKTAQLKESKEKVKDHCFILPFGKI